jgi:hypothetical protein
MPTSKKLITRSEKYFSSFDLLVRELLESFQQQVHGWRFRMLLASQAEDPSPGSSYWVCMAALGGVYGDLLCSRSQEVRSSLDPTGFWGFSFLLYAIKAPWSWGIAFWAFCVRLLCGNVRRLLHIYEGPLGGIGNTAPSSSDGIPMGSKRFALQGIEYAFL